MSTQVIILSQELSSLSTTETDFSLLNLLTCQPVFYTCHHFDELVSTLATLKINFDVIGVSETWNSFANPIKTNVEIPGYSCFPCQSHSQNGGVALYVKSGLIPTPRPDLGNDSTNFEAVWVEVEIEMVKIIYFVVCIVTQALTLIISMYICMKFCPFQLYLINKYLSLVTLMSTF